MTIILSQQKRVSNATNSNDIFSKSNNVFWSFFCIIGICINFGILWKKRRASEAISCWNYRLQNTLMDSQYVKGSERLLKSAMQYLCQTFWSLWNGISSKISALVVYEILTLFVNILTHNDKYSLSVKASVWHNQFKWNYLKIKKYFMNFLLDLRNLHEIWNTLEKKISLRGDLFLKL